MRSTLDSMDRRSSRMGTESRSWRSPPEADFCLLTGYRGVLQVEMTQGQVTVMASPSRVSEQGGSPNRIPPPVKSDKSTELFHLGPKFALDGIIRNYSVSPTHLTGKSRNLHEYRQLNTLFKYFLCLMLLVIIS
jgi:hypothetical protein